ncbi:chemotaxis protein CheB [Bordetella sp. 2513F-2]
MSDSLSLLSDPGAPRRVELVAIGASAGGIEALGALLAGLPAGFPAAVAVVLHLPPGRPSLLASLYQERCALAVKEAEDKEPIAAGCVYFAPPDYHLQVEPDRTFSLSAQPPVHFSRPAVDPLFESAAYAYAGRLLGVVLTGSSADGAEGLLAVRGQGGLAWVQDPDEARAPFMPREALARAGADRIYSLRDMALALARLATPGMEP